MIISHFHFEHTTSGRGVYEITGQIEAHVRESGLKSGICTLFLKHSSASLLINENADSSVRRDLARFFSKFAPQSEIYEHDSEGPDDMPAHILTAFLPTSLSIPVVGARLNLGTWQGIFLWEHRSRGHRRSITVTLMGE